MDQERIGMRISTGKTMAIVSLLLLLLVLAGQTGSGRESDLVPPPDPAPGDYVLLAWSDRGMHFMNRDHSVMSLMPPYSTLRAQVVRRRDSDGSEPGGTPGQAASWPRIQTKDLTLEYSIPGNSWSAGKTDFWDHVSELYGVDLPPDTGLTGKGLSGTFDQYLGYFEAAGIPLTPFPDLSPNQEQPYQKALVVLKDKKGRVLATSTPTLPVSVEMNCTTARCHPSEEEIVLSHPAGNGYDPDQRPMLCASCHAQELIGLSGEKEAGSLSLVIHASHRFIDQEYSHLESCYTCHPGPEAQFNRGIMGHQEGILCQHCHGWISDVASSIDEGREPWLDQPDCDACHVPPHEGGQQTDCDCFFTGGHFGLMCGGCHNSMHAIWPSREKSDNDNVMALQGHAGSLNDCALCHTLSNPTDPEFGHQQQ
jgi:hypothetical protein